MPEQSEDHVEGMNTAAAALKRSFDTGDRSQWEALMADDCVNWHNSDKLVVPSKSGFPGAGGLQSIVSELCCDIVQHAEFAGGQLIRFVIRGTVRATHQPLEAHMCVVLTIDDAGIRRIDDYVDPTLGRQLGLA
jgi:ketosteroid isomerase-like protein